MKKRKLFVTVLAGLLVFGPVMTTTAAEPVSGEAVAAVGKTTQYDGDKEKYQTLIDAMIAAAELDAFGKPAYTWTVPELTDFVNKKFPKMTKSESESDVFWKDGSEPGKEKCVNYHGSNGDNASGAITRTDTTYPDGSWSSQDDATYFYYDGSADSSIQASETLNSMGNITSFVDYHNEKALTKLVTLNGALAMVDDPDLVTYMKTEKELGNSRRYSFPDGTSLTLTPNGNWGTNDKSHLDDVRTYISYYFRNHVIQLHYLNGADGFVEYDTHFTPTDMYRLYNPNSGEHFYTANRKEADGLVAVGWHDEGLGWKAPLMSDTPVYRLYDPNRGDHHYTMNEEEKNNLIAAGWNDEGIGWYSFERETTPLYRLYNPNEVTGNHHYTTSEEERDYLIAQGWKDESIGWYGM